MIAPGVEALRLQGRQHLHLNAVSARGIDVADGRHLLRPAHVLRLARLAARAGHLEPAHQRCHAKRESAVADRTAAVERHLVPRREDMRGTDRIAALLVRLGELDRTRLLQQHLARLGARTVPHRELHVAGAALRRDLEVLHHRHAVREEVPGRRPARLPVVEAVDELPAEPQAEMPRMVLRAKVRHATPVGQAERMHERLVLAVGDLELPHRLAGPYAFHALDGRTHDGHRRLPFQAVRPLAHRPARRLQQVQLPLHLAPVLRIVAEGRVVDTALAVGLAPFEDVSAALRTAPLVSLATFLQHVAPVKDEERANVVLVGMVEVDLVIRPHVVLRQARDGGMRPVGVAERHGLVLPVVPLERAAEKISEPLRAAVARA